MNKSIFVVTTPFTESQKVYIFLGSSPLPPVLPTTLAVFEKGSNKATKNTK